MSGGQQGIVRAPGAPAAGMVARKGFGTQEIEQRAETSTAAAAEQARAMVSAKCILAIERPRSWQKVRDRILADCQRPRFAEEAKYLKPIGDGVEGPSVRFAEACARHMGNLWRTSRVVYEDSYTRHVQLSVMDLETNLTLDEEVVIEKSVERYKVEDREVIGQRTTSKNKVIFIVVATDDEILNKANALKKKAERTLLLAFVPADIVEEAMELVERTKEGAAEQAGQRDRMVADFQKLGVTWNDLQAWLGHPVAMATPRQLAELANVHNAMKDGEGTWADHLESRRGRTQQSSAAPPAPTPAATTHQPATPSPAPAPAVEREVGGDDETAPPTAADGMTDAEKARAILIEKIEGAETAVALNKLALQVRDADAEVMKVYAARKAALTSGGAR